MWRSILSAAALATISVPALAQPPAPNPNAVRVAGTITAVSGDAVTVKAADGTETKVMLTATSTVVMNRPVSPDTIQPGSFVATANMQQPDGTGRSTELRIFEPGNRGGEGSRPMAQPTQIMTNATVTAAKTTAAGREVDVAYPGGTRHIVLPTDVQPVGSFPVAKADIKPGLTLTTQAIKGPDGTLTAARVTLAQPAAAQR